MNIEFLKKIYGLLKNPNLESLNMSLADVHGEKIFSLVIDGTEPGTLTRIFIADRKLKPFEVQLHTHRYPIELTVLKGNIRHFVAIRNSESETRVHLPQFKYQSPLNGGSGLSYLGTGSFEIKDYALPVGSTLQMTENDFHTMAVSKGSIWLVQEKGFAKDTSLVLGVPFITEGLYNKPGQFQINDKVQAVLKVVKLLILDFEAVGNTELQIGNVYYNSHSKTKSVVTEWNINILRSSPENYIYVCKKAHEDDDFSYLCGKDHCKCCQ